MVKVIAYTYEAGTHCIECARAALANGALVPAEGPALPPGADEHGLPYALKDGEGNPIHPIFDTDEMPVSGIYCDSCGTEIVPRDPERAIIQALEAPDPVEAVFRLIEEGIADEREVGEFIANNADECWTHPGDGICEGFAFVNVGSGRVLAAAWDDQGFWDISEMSLDEARSEIESRESECEEEDS